MVRIDEVSTPSPTDRWGRFHFFRRRKPAQILVDKAWAESSSTHIYLGSGIVMPKTFRPRQHTMFKNGPGSSLNPSRCAPKGIYDICPSHEHSSDRLSPAPRSATVQAQQRHLRPPSCWWVWTCQAAQTDSRTQYRARERSPAHAAVVLIVFGLWQSRCGPILDHRIPGGKGCLALPQANSANQRRELFFIVVIAIFLGSANPGTGPGPSVRDSENQVRTSTCTSSSHAKSWLGL
jgi:hypothetical protein